MKYFLRQFAPLMLLAFVALAPHAAHAQTASSTVSVFDCAGSGLEVGVRQSLVNVYVPVNDSAVTRNTANTVDDLNRLVYKECVLNIVTRQQADAAIGNEVATTLNQANTGRGGAPEFVSNPQQELQTRATQSIAEFINKYNTDNICAPFQDQAKVALARQYMRSVNDPASAFRCSLGLAPADQTSFLAGQTSKDNPNTLWQLFTNPANNPYGASVAINEAAYQQAENDTQSLLLQWGWGHGFYPTETQIKFPTASGDKRTVNYTITPAYIVSQIVAQATLAGFTRLENTDQFGQIPASALANLTNQVMATAAGFSGLSNSTTGGGIPFLTQLANTTLGNLRNTVTSTALARVQSAIATEELYAQVKGQTLQVLNDTAKQLQTAEDQCWAQIVPAVQALAAKGNCTTGTGIGGLGGITVCTPIKLSISTTSVKITGGTGTLTLNPNSTISSGAVFSFQVQPSNQITSGTLSLQGRISTTSSSTPFALAFDVNGSPSPIPVGSTVSLTTAATTSVGAGTLAFTLGNGQKLSIGAVPVTFTTFSPFASAGVVLTTDLARPFADPVIAANITPVVEQVQQDIANSAQGLALLLSIQANLQNTSDPAIQQAAINQLESALANGTIHSQYDEQNAEIQRSTVTGSTQTLISNTNTSWTTNGNWCEVGNPNVIQKWLDTWKV